MNAFTHPEKVREAWLIQVAAGFAPVLAERAGLTFPPYRVTCGFPSSGGTLGRKSLTRGECWRADMSADGHAEIFINPVIDDAPTVAAILAHELIHAALPDAAHGKPFQAAARKIGHAAPFTSANPTDAFTDWAAPIWTAAGDYPHAMLNAQAAIGAKKKQGTRMLKAECGECGYCVRLSRKWLDEVGAPHCPAHGEMIADAGDDGDQLEDADLG